MSGIAIIVLGEGYDDMSLLSCQVILEENSTDVIISSLINGAVKGEDSSVMAVSFQEAMKQEVEYSALIVLGGKNIENWDLLNSAIRKFNDEGKIVAGIQNGIDVIKGVLPDCSYSVDSSIIEDTNIITLFDSESVEIFAERLAEILNQ
ncbi:MAG: hypothetical protein INQ03_07200 [Candidatus Heimdallarchaeota archaeon]|nr:hypothetical protein [Candidatus Heimdallarchaeota archaeon]